MEWKIDYGSVFQNNESDTKKEETSTIKYFCEKLMDWINDPFIDSIEWIDVDGKECVFVRDKEDFAAQCYNGKFSNFRRQLSEYRFKRVHIFKGQTENKNRAIFHSEHFYKGAIVKNMRRALKNTSVKSEPTEQLFEMDITEQDPVVSPQFQMLTFAEMIACKRSSISDCRKHANTL